MSIINKLFFVCFVSLWENYIDLPWIIPQSHKGTKTHGIAKVSLLHHSLFLVPCSIFTVFCDQAPVTYLCRFICQNPANAGFRRPVPIACFSNSRYEQENSICSDFRFL